MRSYPDGAKRWLISRGGGWAPRWLRSGREIVYCNANKMMAVAISTVHGFEPGTPHPLFEVPSAIVMSSGDRKSVV